jgi:hypothetical protein
MTPLSGIFSEYQWFLPLNCSSTLASDFGVISSKQPRFQVYLRDPLLQIAIVTAYPSLELSSIIYACFYMLVRATDLPCPSYIKS